jgi:hypothetical protein
MVKIEEIMDLFDLRSKQIEIVDGVVNITGDVDLRYRFKTSKLVKTIPVQFGIVNGNFLIEDRKLTSLKNAPYRVDGTVSFVNNKLTNLIGCPKIIKENLYLAGNSFTTLKDLPITIKKLSLDYSKHLPLLPLVTKDVYLFNIDNSLLNSIFIKYINRHDLKKAILECQKELIENGFIENARW